MLLPNGEANAITVVRGGIFSIKGDALDFFPTLL